MASLSNARHYRLSVAGFEIPVGGRIDTTNDRLCGDAFATLSALQMAGEIEMTLDPEDPGTLTMEPARFAPEIIEEPVAEEDPAQAQAEAEDQAKKKQAEEDARAAEQAEAEARAESDAAAEAKAKEQAEADAIANVQAEADALAAFEAEVKEAEAKAAAQAVEEAQAAIATAEKII